MSFDDLVRESLVVIDGGEDAELPPSGQWPVVAGPEAIVIAGRVDVDAPTRIRMGVGLQPSSSVTLAFSGQVATPTLQLRLVSVATGSVLAVERAKARSTQVRIYLSDFDEPDEIVVLVVD